MTASTDFERFLASVLDADGPQTVDERIVDAALASARATSQRRPIIRGLDRRAWPIARPIGRHGRRLVIALVAVAALVAMVLAAILAGSGASRWELARDDRIVVMGSRRVVVVDAAGAVTYDVAGSFGSCVPVVRGTTVAAIQEAGGISLTDLATGRRHGRLVLDYARRFERWSTRGDRVAQVDVAGTITLLDVTKPNAPATLRVIDAPGVAGFDWSLDGRRAAFARFVDGELVIEAIDVAIGERSVEHVQSLDEREPANTIGEITVDLAWSSDGTTLALLVIPSNGETTWAVTSISMDGGHSHQIAMTDAPGRVRISRDGSWIAAPLGPTGMTIASTDGASSVDIRTENSVSDVAWSPDGRWLAANDNSGLLLIPPDDPIPVRIGANGTIHGFAWTPDSSSLLVAAHDNGEAIVLQRVDVVNQRREHLADLGSESDWRGETCIRIEEKVR